MLTTRQQRPQGADILLYYFGYTLLGQMCAGALYGAVIIVGSFVVIPSYVHLTMVLIWPALIGLAANEKMIRRLPKVGIVIVSIIGALISHVFLKMIIDLITSGAK